MSGRVFAFLCIVCLLPPLNARASSVGEVWQRRDDLTREDRMFGRSGVAWINGRWIAVGPENLIHTSEDGDTWTERIVTLPGEPVDSLRPACMIATPAIELSRDRPMASTGQT